MFCSTLTTIFWFCSDTQCFCYVLTPNASWLVWHSVLLKDAAQRVAKSEWLFETLQHTATHGNTRQHTATHGNTRQHTATHCNTLQRIVSFCRMRRLMWHMLATSRLADIGKRKWLFNTLQHTATHCNTLQHTATHCNTLQHPAILLQNTKTDPTYDGDKQTGRHSGNGAENSGRLGGMGGEGGGDMQNDVDWSYCYSPDARIAFDRWQMLHSQKVCSLLHRLWKMTIALTFENFFTSFAVIPCSGCLTLRMRTMVEFFKSRLCSYIIEHI